MGEALITRRGDGGEYRQFLPDEISISGSDMTLTLAGVNLPNTPKAFTVAFYANAVFYKSATGTSGSTSRGVHFFAYSEENGCSVIRRIGDNGGEDVATAAIPNFTFEISGADLVITTERIKFNSASACMGAIFIL